MDDQHDRPPDDPRAAGPVYGRVTRFGVPAPSVPLVRPAGGAYVSSGAPLAAGPGPAPAGWSPPASAPPWVPTARPVASWPPPGGPVAYAAPPRPRWRRDQYAPWASRALGELVDDLPSYVGLVLLVLAYEPLFTGLVRGDLDARPRWGLLVAGMVLCLASVAWSAWNRWVCAGRTGQSLGRRLTGSRLVSAEDGRPVGTLNAFLRDLLHVLDGFGCGVGYLWPLWDAERQTFADKIAQTVVVRVGREQPDRWD